MNHNRTAAGHLAAFVTILIWEIADRYGGDTLFEQKAGMFYASVWLQIPEKADN